MAVRTSASVPDRLDAGCWGVAGTLGPQHALHGGGANAQLAGDLEHALAPRRGSPALPPAAPVGGQAASPAPWLVCHGRFGIPRSFSASAILRTLVIPSFPQHPTLALVRTSAPWPLEGGNRARQPYRWLFRNAGKNNSDRDQEFPLPVVTSNFRRINCPGVLVDSGLRITSPSSFTALLHSLELTV